MAEPRRRRGARLGVHLDYRFRRAGGTVSTERAFALFAFALADHAAALTLIGRLEPEEGAYPYPLPERVGFAPLPFYPSLAAPGAMGALPRSVLAFWRALAHVDVVWLLGPHPLAVPFALVARLRGRRVRLGVRQDLRAYARSRHGGRRAVVLAADVLEGAFRLLARVTPTAVVGEDLGARYARARRLHVMHVSLVRAADIRPGPPAADPRRVISVGRLDAEKNPLLLADVAARLGEEWTLDVYGEGPLAADLRRRADKLGVGDRLRLHGYVAHAALERAYREAGALLHVSYTEGAPQVLLEAFGAHVPVVATAVGGVPALAGDAALLVAPGDARAAADALARLAAEPALRRRLAAAGEQRARERTLEAEAARLAAFLLDPGPGGPPRGGGRSPRDQLRRSDTACP